LLSAAARSNGSSRNSNEEDGGNDDYDGGGGFPSLRGSYYVRAFIHAVRYCTGTNKAAIRYNTVQHSTAQHSTQAASPPWSLATTGLLFVFCFSLGTSFTSYIELFASIYAMR